MIPMARPCAPFVPVTGTAPQSHSTIICATSRRLVSGVHVAGLSVMMSRIVISYPPLIFTTTKSGAALFCDRSDYRHGHRRGFDEPAFPNPNVTAVWFLVLGFSGTGFSDSLHKGFGLAAQFYRSCIAQRSRPRSNARCPSPTAPTLIAHGPAPIAHPP